MSTKPVGESRADERPWRRGAFINGVKDRAATWKPQVVPRSLRMFPFTAPNTPTSVEPLAVEDELGMNFNTEWAREPGARIARRAIQNALLIPGLRALTTPEILGLDRIQHLSGPLIFAANHHSHLDTGVVLSALPRKIREKTIIAAASDYFFDKRLKAILSALTINAVPIERKKVSRRSTDQIKALLLDGWSIVIFPEGGRSPDGLGQEFKAGAMFLAQRSGCVVVPVHIDGTNVVLPKGATFPKRHTCTVTFGHPIAADSSADPRALSEQLERAVNALAEESRTDWWTARRNAATDATPSLRGNESASSWRRQWSKSSTKATAEKPKRTWP